MAGVSALEQNGKVASPVPSDLAQLISWCRTPREENGIPGEIQKGSQAPFGRLNEGGSREGERHQPAASGG